MPASKRAALMWSGGKDSSLALHHLRRHDPELQVVTLLTCLSQAYDRVSMHGVRRALIRAQADALGLPVEFVVIPRQDDPPCPLTLDCPLDDPPCPVTLDCPTTAAIFPSNDLYSRTMHAVFERLKASGVEVIVFGDIHLEDLRAYRDRLLSASGLEGRYPLWGRDPAAVFEEFVALGYRAVTVCVDTERLPEECLGKPLDAAFRDALPVGTDLCGERGEYHSFVFDGPFFERSVNVRLGGVHRYASFVFQELIDTMPPTVSADEAGLFAPVAPVAAVADLAEER